jgi:hypothetical protein
MHSPDVSGAILSCHSPQLQWELVARKLVAAACIVQSMPINTPEHTHMHIPMHINMNTPMPIPIAHAHVQEGDGLSPTPMHVRMNVTIPMHLDMNTSMHIHMCRRVMGCPPQPFVRSFYCVSFVTSTS